MEVLKSIVIIDDYAFINGGAASVAIRSACYLADNTDKDVYYFSAVGPISDELKGSNFKEIICLEQYDILSNPNKGEAFLQGIWNKKSKTELTNFLVKLDSSSTIIHVHTWTKALSSSIFEAMEAGGFKVAVTLHDYFISCPNGGYFNYQKSEICNLKPMTINCILCNCDSRRYYFKIWRVARQYIQNKNILGNGYISYIYISDFSKKQIERRLALPNNKLIFVNNPVDFINRYKVEASENEMYMYLGRLSEEKGIRLFCEIVDSLGLDAVVIGDGPLYSEMKEKYDKRIIFTGWLSKEQIKKYFDKTRALIFTSLWYETLGLTVLEAMSYGIPCLVPDNCAASDLINNENNGMLYSAGSKSSLIKVIDRMKEDDLVKLLSNNSYSGFDESKYSMNTHASNLISAYKSILSNKK